MAVKKLLNYPQVIELTGLSKSTIERLEKKGEFPQKTKLSIKRVAWTEEEILNWIESLKKECKND